MTFRNLLPGQPFVFVEANGTDGMRWGSSAPWVKMSPRTYMSLNDYTRYSGKSGSFYQTSASAKVRAVKEEASQ